MSKLNLFRGKWSFLLVVQVSNLIASIDSTIVNISLPSLAQDLHVEMRSAQWVITAYLISIMSGLLVAGRVADQFGRERVFTVGYAVFALASVLCGVSTDIQMLIGARVLQGMGGAILLANASALLSSNFAGEARGVALGLNSTIVAVGYALGYVLGGLVAQHWGWRAIFFVNLPVSLWALYFCVRHILPTKNAAVQPVKGGFDWRGALLSGGGVAGVLISFDLLHDQSASSPQFLGAIGGSLLLLVGFVWSQLHHPHPLLGLDLFRYASVSTGLSSLFMFAAALSASNFVLPFYLQGVLGQTAAQAGWVLLPYSLSLLLLSPLTGWMSVRMNPGWLSALGFLLGACISVGYLGLDTRSSVVWVALGQLGIGAAGASFLSPNRVVILSTVPDNRLGVASALIQTCRFLALSAGTLLASGLVDAALGPLGGIKTVLQPGTGQAVAAQAFLGGMDRVFFVLTALMLSGVAISAWGASRRPENHLEHHT